MIQINNLCKSFGKVQVLNNLTLTIPDGSVFGMVGPNGAGKTTTFRILAGLLSPNSGQILLDGRSADKRLKENIGYMPDFFGVYDRLKISEYMEFFASINNMKENEAKRKIDELLDLVGLLDIKDQYVDNLSRGTKQKLCLARCMIHDPKLLILDEPASGMDPRARHELREIILKLHEKGTTIMISSHILSELAHICTDICIIDKGKCVLSGTVADIEYHMSSSSRLIIKLISGREEAVRILDEDPLADKLSYLGNEIYVTYSGSTEEQAALLTKMTAEGVRIFSFTCDNGGLEDLFMEITGRNE